MNLQRKFTLHLAPLAFAVAGLWMATGQAQSAPASSTVQTSITALAWLAGSWAGTADGVQMEEHWTAPGGGAMVGMHRDVAKGRMVSYEFLRIEEQNGTLVYVASPGGATPTRFPAIELGHSRVVFENPTHDFPQRVIYWRDGADLRARIEGKKGIQPMHMEWRWTPASLTGR
jgi:hypothetical protein